MTNSARGVRLAADGRWRCAACAGAAATSRRCAIEMPAARGAPRFVPGQAGGRGPGRPGRARGLRPAAILSEFAPPVGRPGDRRAHARGPGGDRPDLCRRARRHAIKSEGYDLCSTTHCQLYQPARLRTSRWARPRRGGGPRAPPAWSCGTAPRRPSALFHADCGGHTSAAADVWGGRRGPTLGRSRRRRRRERRTRPGGTRSAVPRCSRRSTPTRGRGWAHGSPTSPSRSRRRRARGAWWHSKGRAQTSGPRRGAARRSLTRDVRRRIDPEHAVRGPRQGARSSLRAGLRPRRRPVPGRRLARLQAGARPERCWPAIFQARGCIVTAVQGRVGSRCHALRTELGIGDSAASRIVASRSPSLSRTLASSRRRRC